MTTEHMEELTDGERLGGVRSRARDGGTDPARDGAYAPVIDVAQGTDQALGWSRL